MTVKRKIISCCLAFILCVSNLTSCTAKSEVTAEDILANRETVSMDEFDIEAYRQQNESENKAERQSGNIYDCNGNVIVYTEKTNSGDLQRVIAGDTPEAFSPLVSRYSTGIDSINEDTLRKPDSNGTEDSFGRSLSSTVDGSLTVKLYNLLESYKIDGCIVVLRQDGSLAACVSTPSYDANRYFKDSEYNAEITSNADSPLINKGIEAYAPGSTFKMISGSLLVKHNGYDRTYLDNGYTLVNGVEVHNYDYPSSIYPTHRTCREAVYNSSNVIFTEFFMNTDRDIILNEARDYFYLASDLVISTDFGELRNVFTNTDPRSSFGQHDDKMSPVYIGMLSLQMFNGGKMLLPFSVSTECSTQNPEYVIGTKKKAEVLASVPEEYTKAVREAMTDLGGGLSEELPEQYRVMLKTGTAQRDNYPDMLYIAGYLDNVSNDNKELNIDSLGGYSGYTGDYAVVLEIRNSDELNIAVASKASFIYGEALSLFFE